MEQQFKKLFFRELDIPIENTKEFLHRGAFQTLSEGKEQAGYLRGLEEAKIIFEELYLKLTQSKE